MPSQGNHLDCPPLPEFVPLPQEDWGISSSLSISIVEGPATAPQPVLETRVRAGHLEARVHEIPGVPAS